MPSQQQQQHTIAARAQIGFSNAASYDSHRPSYPADAVENLLQHLHIAGRPNARIVDLAAGTGKFTELLAARVEDYEIVAVEPHVDMLGVLKEKGLPGVRALEGSAGDMAGLEEGWADAVVVAQGFHWFPTPEALEEIHRVLKPGGGLGLIWNFDDCNSRIDYTPTTVWEGQLRALSQSHEDRHGERHHNLWPEVFKNQNMFSAPLAEDGVQWSIWRTKDALWDRLSTISHMASLDEEKRNLAQERVAEIMSGEDVKTNEQGEVESHGRTVYYWTTSKD